MAEQQTRVPSPTAGASAAPVQQQTVNRRRPEQGSRQEWIVVHVLYLIIVIFFFAPFLWLLTAAFDGDAVAYIRWPAQPTFANFTYVYQNFHIGRALANSLFISTATMLLSVVLVSLAAYSLSRLEFGLKSVVTYGVLVLQTMPLSATMVPIYGLARDLHLRNTYLGLILVHSAIEMPFLIWLMKGFFDTIPRYLEEAAWLDGRSKFRAWWEVVMPVARPGIVVIAGFAFLNAWSEVLMVIILVDDPGKSTVPLAFYQTFRSNGGYNEVNYGLVAAVGVIYVLPVIALFFSLRKMMVRGLMSTSRGL
ncbi:MAG TPA: carbohydrate ABC transporter permease [Thermomicrobiales bacterium]|nr:carbohydrate ABC transporter permease [Thermomicrobiales bacterium]